MHTSKKCTTFAADFKKISEVILPILRKYTKQELIAYIGYTHNRKKLSYWHTYDGKEVDAVIGDAETSRGKADS